MVHNRNLMRIEDRNCKGQGGINISDVPLASAFKSVVGASSLFYGRSEAQLRSGQLTLLEDVPNCGRKVVSKAAAD